MGEQSISQPIKLALYKISSTDGTYIPVGSEIVLYKNGVECDSTVFLVMPNEKIVTLGVVFSEDAAEGNYDWYLKVLDVGDLDVLNGNLTSSELPFLIQWNAQYKRKMNPLLLVLLLLLCIMLLLCFIWFCIFKRIVYPRFRFTDLQIIYMDDGCKKGLQSISLHGLRRVVLTVSTKRQSVWNRIFTGKIEYIENNFWENDVILDPMGEQGIGFDKGLSTIYRIKTNRIAPTNSARRPFVVMKSNGNMSANISI